MLSHCANSRCSRPFLHLRQGKLFLVETEGVSSGEVTAAPSSSYAAKGPPGRAVLVV